VVAPKPPPLPPPVLGLSDLLSALDAETAAYAAGRPLTEEDRLAGRRFVIRQAFGCAAPAPSNGDREPGVAQWSWGREHKSIELSLTPADWAKAPVMADGDGAWEAAEGFWLARPWLPSGECPVRRPEVEAARAPASPQTAGLAAVFEHDGSRLVRRAGKSFVATIRDEALLAPPSGYRLVLEGRFTAFPAGRAARCHAPGPDQRPVCIAVAEIDRVAFEDADGQLINEWRPG
jgi:hypothetical protein